MGIVNVLFMKKIFPALVLPLLLFACSKDKENEIVAPAAEFWLSGVVPYVNGEFIVPAYFKFRTENVSKNAVSYAWDFGNGQTSSKKDTVSFYAESGSYTITLVATGSNGGMTQISKKVKVVDRLLYNVLYRSASWANATPVNVFLRIYKPAANNAVPALYGEAYASDVYYQSQTAATTYFTNALLQIAIPEKVTLLPVSNYLNNTVPDAFINYGYCFYTIENGHEKLLVSSWEADARLTYSESMESGTSRWMISGNKGQLVLYATHY